MRLSLSVKTVTFGTCFSNPTEIISSTSYQGFLHDVLSLAINPRSSPGIRNRADSIPLIEREYRHYSKCGGAVVPSRFFCCSDNGDPPGRLLAVHSQHPIRDGHEETIALPKK